MGEELSYSDWYAIALAKLKETGLPLPDEEVFVFSHMDKLSIEEFIEQYKISLDEQKNN